MQPIKRSEKIAWFATIFFTIVLFLVHHLSANRPNKKHLICYPGINNITECDTVVKYEVIPIFGFDSCYKYSLVDKSERIICGDAKITDLP